MMPPLDPANLDGPGRTACHCQDCNLTAWWMILCPTCGNKRCPHAAHHLNGCTGSNAIDQPMEHLPRPQNRLAACLEGPGRTREEMAANSRELERVAPMLKDKIGLMMGKVSPTPLTDEAIRAADGQWSFLVRDLCRDFERKLAPFLRVAQGIPDNWPGQCILRFDQREDGSIFLSYHGVNDASNGITIAEWRALLPASTP